MYIMQSTISLYSKVPAQIRDLWCYPHFRQSLLFCLILMPLPSPLSTASEVATMAKQLLLVGDSNVRRYFNQLGSGYSSSVSFIQARNLAEWSEAIPSCKSGYEIVVYSFLTILIFLDELGQKC